MTQRANRASTMAMEHEASLRRDSRWRGGGSIPGTPARPAFFLLEPDPAPIPVLIAVPHAGRHYPADLVSAMKVPAESALRLEDRLIDLVAMEVARRSGAHLLVAQAPRAMIDLNRAPDDMDWDMVAGGQAVPRARRGAGRRSRNGLGLVPRRLPGLGELWSRRLSPAQLASRIEQVHAPYHRALGEALEGLRDRWGAALLVDLHSMPPLGPKTGAESAPDIVLGDRFGSSCSGGLVRSALDYLARENCPAAHNRPYAGGYVLDRHGRPARGVHALQVEVCRTTYLDAALAERGPGLAPMAERLTGLVQTLAAQMGTSQGTAQAAE